MDYDENDKGNSISVIFWLLFACTPGTSISFTPLFVCRMYCQLCFPLKYIYLTELAVNNMTFSKKASFKILVGCLVVLFVKSSKNS